VILAGVLVMDDITEQKRVEDGLRYNAGLLENMEDAVIATDERFVVTAWNRGAESLYGWTADEVLGSDARKILRSDLSDVQRAEAIRTLERGPSRAERTRSRKDGTPVEVEAVNVAIRGERGDITGFLGIHRDISERRRAEEALREAHRRSETILESITDAFFAVDREWRFTYMNKRGLARLEKARGKPCTLDELLGKVYWDEFPEVVGTTFDERYHLALREQRAVEFETYSPTTGTWLEVRAYPSEEGLSVFGRDITERRRAEEERERRALQQALVAELGLRALATDDLQPLMDEAVGLIAGTVGVELVGVAEVLPGREMALLRAGVGWNEGVVGHGTGIAGPGSLVGHTIASGEPVVSEDLAADERFEVSALLSEHDAVSGAIVVIAGRDEPFGSLGAFSTHRHFFADHDVNIMQAVANVLATAVERSETQERLTEVREVERHRIARDLHDEALRDLTEALVLAGGAGSASGEPDAASRLAGLVPVLKRVGEQVRGAIYDLRLGGDEDRPFPELLQALVDLHRAMALDCEIELEVRDGVPNHALGATGTDMLRVLGEALTNARRHSEARHVSVRVWGSERRLCAAVSDDGRGFDTTGRSPAVNGSGIRGMRERAGLIRGELDIRSEPDVGTSVRIEVLLPDGDEPAEQVRVLLVEDHASVRRRSRPRSSARTALRSSAKRRRWPRRARCSTTSTWRCSTSDSPTATAQTSSRSSARSTDARRRSC
jgi:PAS domain S-box-containing protein